MLKLFILLGIKLKEERLLGHVGIIVDDLCEKLKMLHLLVEVATVKLHIKNRLIKRLQFPNGKLLR